MKACPGTGTHAAGQIAHSISNTLGIIHVVDWILWAQAAGSRQTPAETARQSAPCRTTFPVHRPDAGWQERACCAISLIGAIRNAPRFTSGKRQATNATALIQIILDAKKLDLN
jgi:hypothetical protein